MRIGSDCRVVVTGSAGVIGRELLRRLAERRATILSVDREALPESERHLPGVTHLRQDLADAPIDGLREFRAQVVFHLAAAFERSKESPGFWQENWHDNLIVSHRIAEICADVGVKTVVFASSYLIYSPSLYTFQSARAAAPRLREDAAVAPRNLCGAAKFYTEHEIQFVDEYLNPHMRPVYARIYRVFGRGSCDVVSRWVRCSLENEPIVLYNRENYFDYIFAGDVAEGLLRLAECDEARGVVNLGTGCARGVHEVLKAIVGHVPGIRQRVTDEGSPEPFEASCADVSKLRKLLDWTPETSLEDGISLVYEYERSRSRGEGDDQVLPS